jgi:hypothetical protein
MQPTTIDLSGLPEPVARDIAKLVETLREKLGEPRPAARPGILPRWEGTVLGTISRRELYDDGD